MESIDPPTPGPSRALKVGGRDSFDAGPLTVVCPPAPFIPIIDRSFDRASQRFRPVGDASLLNGEIRGDVLSTFFFNSSY